MATQIWMQDNFSKGELSPYMYGRASVAQYFDGLKQAQNVLTYPTGAAGKRFGSLFQSFLEAGITSFNQIFFQTFQYLDQCIYQLVFSPLKITIYLEGLAVATVATTFDAHDVYNLNYTILGAAFRVTGEGFAPFDLTRSAYSPQTISAISGNAFVIPSTFFLVGKPLPVTFTTTGTLPSTTPQIKIGVVYYIAGVTTTTGKVYSSAYNAKFNIDPFTLNTTGSGTNNILIQNTWTFAHSTFKNLPVSVAA